MGKRDGLTVGVVVLSVITAALFFAVLAYAGCCIARRVERLEMWNDHLMREGFEVD